MDNDSHNLGKLSIIQATKQATSKYNFTTGYLYQYYENTQSHAIHEILVTSKTKIAKYGEDVPKRRTVFKLVTDIPEFEHDKMFMM